MTVYVYGASDDLIQIEGSLTEEFYAPTGRVSEGGPYYLGFSDGTLLKINYDGEWNIKLVEGQALIIPAHSQAKKEFETKGHEFSHIPNYTDIAAVYGDVTWVVGGTDVVK